jgi:CheY-like chemotaxis protein
MTDDNSGTFSPSTMMRDSWRSSGVLLERLGYRAHIASNPNEAIKLYEEQWRDIKMVILDFRLPQMSGDLIFEKLQRLNPDVRVCLLTSHNECVAEKMFEKGLRGYLQKPFSFPDLTQRVQDALDAPAVPSSPSPANR